MLAREREEKNLEIAQWFDISESAVESILRLHRNTGNVVPKPYTGRKSSITDEMIILIKDMIEKKPDSTLDEIQTFFCFPQRTQRDF